MSRSVAEILAVPTDVVFSLLRGPEEAPQASALLLTASRGVQLHDLLAVQAAQQECDVSAIHKACTFLVSSKDPALTGLAPPVMQAAAAATRAADVLQARVTDCLTALANLSAQLNQHAQISAAVASQLRRQPGCRELAIERELVAGIQREAAHRAAHVARLRGHCALPPFAHALEALKAEAAAQLHLAAAEAPLPTSAAIEGQIQPVARPQAPPAPDLHEKVDVLARSLHLVASRVDQLIGLMPGAAGTTAVAAGPSQLQIQQQQQQQIEGGGSGGRSVDSQQHQQVQQQEPQQQRAVSPAAASQPPLIEELSPGGTTVIDPENADALQDVAHASQRGGGGGSGNDTAPGRRALRGDAAPSTTAEGDADGNASIPRPSAADGEEPQTLPSLHPPLSAELPSAVIPGTVGLCREVTEPQESEEREEEKENVDATQSQGAGGSAEAAAVTQPTEETTGEKGGSAKREEGATEEQPIALSEPEATPVEGDAALPLPLPPPRPTGRQAALPTVAAAVKAARPAIGPSQKDSTSPGGGHGGAVPPGSHPLTGTTTTTKSGGSGGSGSGNGVAVPKGAETPAGPSRVLMPPPGPTSQPLVPGFSPSVLAQRPPSTTRSDYYGKRRVMDTPGLPPSSIVGPKRARLGGVGGVPVSQEDGERVGSADDGAGPASQPLLSNEMAGALPSLGAWRQGPPSQTPNLLSVLKRDLKAMSEVPESPDLLGAAAEATPMTAAAAGTAAAAHQRQISERARRTTNAGDTPFAFAQKGATQMISMGVTPQPTARPSLEVGQQVLSGEGVESKGVGGGDNEEESEDKK